MVWFWNRKVWWTLKNTCTENYGIHCLQLNIRHQGLLYPIVSDKDKGNTSKKGLFLCKIRPPRHQLLINPYLLAIEIKIKRVASFREVSSHTYIDNFFNLRYYSIVIV